MKLNIKIYKHNKKIADFFSESGYKIYDYEFIGDYYVIELVEDKIVVDDWEMKLNIKIYKHNKKIADFFSENRTFTDSQYELG